MSGLDLDRPRRAVNRVLLALAGAAALCGGGWIAARGLHERGTPVPLPLPDVHGAVNAGVRALEPWDDRTWWAIAAVITALTAVLGLLLLWLLAQTGPRSPRMLPLPGDGLATRTRALARATAADAEVLPGVTRARVHLSRRRGRVRARLVVTLGTQAEPATVLRQLSQGAVEGLRTGSGATRLDCAVRLRRPSHRAQRVL